MGMNPEDMRIGEKADLTLWKRNFNFTDDLCDRFVIRMAEDCCQ